MSMNHGNIMSKERELAANLIHDILIKLHAHFPWTVIEIAISFNERLEENSAFVVKVLENVMDEESKQKMADYLPECTDTGALPSDVAAQLMHSFSHEDVSALLNQSFFSLNTEQKEECLPWDLAEQPMSFESLGDEKTMAIVNIKMKLRELAMLRGIIARYEEECGIECIAIDTVFEILNFEMV